MCLCILKKLYECECRTSTWIKFQNKLIMYQKLVVIMYMLKFKKIIIIAYVCFKN